MLDEKNCSIGNGEKMISDEFFEFEISLCQELAIKNGGSCAWGKCEQCGVIPLLIKLNKGELLETPEEIKIAKDEIFGNKKIK